MAEGKLNTINNYRHDSKGKGTSCVELAHLKRCVLAKEVPNDISDTDLYTAFHQQKLPKCNSQTFCQTPGDRMTTVKIDFAQTEEYE